MINATQEAADAYALGRTAGEAGMSKNVPLAVAEFGDAHADAWRAGHDDGKAVKQ